MAAKDTLIDTLNILQVDGEIRAEIIAKFDELAQEAKADRALEKSKRGKKQYVVVLKSPSPLPEDIVSSIWVMKEDGDPNTLFDKIRSATVDNNLAARKAKNRIFEFSNILSFLKPKWLKNYEIKKLSKDWERTLVITDEKFLEETPFE